MTFYDILTKIFTFVRIYDTYCHSDDRREEDVLLSEAKNLGNKKWVISRSFALDDNSVFGLTIKENL